MASNNISAVFKGGMNFTAEVNGHKIEIDTEEAAGGKNIGTRPKALMLVSLAGCTGFDVVSILNKMRVNFSDLSVNVEGHLTETEPKIYDGVHLNYSIKVKKEDEEKVLKAVNALQLTYFIINKKIQPLTSIYLNLF